MTSTDLVLEELASRGLLLKQDKALPSVVGILTGESLSSSWWSHPKARLIFRVLSELEDHPDIVITKLLSGKDTVVHRGLWPALLAVATAREPWQLRGLSAPAKKLLGRIDGGEEGVQASGKPVGELTARLLAVTQEVHTPSGRHETVIEPWQTWAARVHSSPAGSVAKARLRLEQAAADLGAPRKALPWPDTSRPVERV